MTDRLVRVPRLADRSLVPAGVPEEAALVDRSDLSTIRLRRGSVKGKTQDVVVGREERPQHVVAGSRGVSHAWSTWWSGFSTFLCRSSTLFAAVVHGRRGGCPRVVHRTAVLFYLLLPIG